MSVTRRKVITSTLGAITTMAFPLIVPSSVFGKNAPSNRINIGAIGIGRIARSHDLPEVLKHDDARVIAVCDLDAKRVQSGIVFVNDAYASKLGKTYTGTIGYADYHQLLANKDIDAVIISTPDHQHAIPAVHAVRAGKDVYLQKPASLTIAEGRYLSDAVAATKRIVQVGSQQRSLDPWPQFHRACELVRNGRIGKLQHVEIGLPGDPAGGDATPMPIPANLDYDAWLGSTPEVFYTEHRVHPQDSFDRPGWLRCEQFGAGMITGWGAHHIDIAHWAMDMEHGGPVEVWGEAEFPSIGSMGGLWNVHGKFETHARYANGVEMRISGELPNGVKFIGSEGWLFVTRSGQVTASDPSSPKIDPLTASNPKILSSVIGANEVHLYRSTEQHRNWLDCVRSRKQPIAPIEIGHRACSTCLLHHIAMHTKRKLQWDSKIERFVNDSAANAMLSRPQRKSYVF